MGQHSISSPSLLIDPFVVSRFNYYLYLNQTLAFNILMAPGNFEMAISNGKKNNIYLAYYIKVQVIY